MNNDELDQLVRRSAVPERPAEFWDQFPGKVIEGITPAHRPASKPTTDRGYWLTLFGSPLRPLAFGLGLAVMCAVVGFALGFWKGQQSTAGDSQLAEMRKCFREIEAMFPHQVQAIVLDQKGARLVLADQPNLPAAPPLYLRICGPSGCQRFVTFSGQQICVNGDVCDVLLDRHGSVLLVGQRLLWSASQPTDSGTYRIEAHPLDTAL